MVLFKTFVLPFYKSNAGFFLFFLFLFFGTVNSGMLITYHLSLIQSIISSVVVLTGVLLLWLLYSFKCIRFCQEVIRNPAGSFIYNLQAFSNVKQLTLWGMVHLLMYAPVLVYAVVVIYIALLQQRWSMALTVAGWQVVMLISAPLLHAKIINSSWKEQGAFRYLFNKKNSRRKSFLEFQLYYLLQQKGKVILALKLFSFLLLYIMLLNGKDTGHDYLVLVFLAILLAHIKLPLQLTAFMEGALGFHRNLPLSTANIAFSYVFTFALLLLPDMFFLAIKSRGIFPLMDVAAFYVFGVLTLFLLVAVQYSSSMNVSEYTKIVFGVFFVSVFALYSRNYMVLFAAETIVAIILFLNGYWQYEGERLE